MSTAFTLPPSKETNYMATPTPTKSTKPKEAAIPTITADMLRETHQALATADGKPLFPPGVRTQCPVCSQESMVTTNNLVRRVATPIGLVIVARLPGAQCGTCGAMELDASALTIIRENLQNEIRADYVTKVSRSGNVPAILIKEDLRRVLNLTGNEHISWKVIDADHAYVEIQRPQA